MVKAHAPRLKEVAENVWAVDSDLTFVKWTVVLPIRCVIIRLEDGKLWMWSPVDFDSAALEEIKQLGEVSDIVAPNKNHSLFTADAIKLFPKAETWISPAVQVQAEGADRPRFRVDHLLSMTQGRRPRWQTEIEMLELEGHELGEFVFFHTASKSLIVTDLLMNMGANEFKLRGCLSGFVLKRMGFIKGSELCVCDEVREQITDVDALNASIKKMLQWDVQVLVCAHGKVFEVQDEDARTEIQRALDLTDSLAITA